MSIVNEIMEIPLGLIKRYMIIYYCQYSDTTGSKVVTKEMASWVEVHVSRERVKDFNSVLQYFEYQVKNSPTPKNINIAFINENQDFGRNYPDTVLDEKFLSSLSEARIRNIFRLINGYVDGNLDDRIPTIINRLIDFFPYGWSSELTYDEAADFRDDKKKYNEMALEDLCSRIMYLDVPTPQLVNYLYALPHTITVINNNQTYYGDLTFEELARNIMIPVKYHRTIVDHPLNLQPLSICPSLLTSVKNMEVDLNQHLNSGKKFLNTTEDATNIIVIKDRVEWKQYGVTLTTLPFGLRSDIESLNIISTRYDGRNSHSDNETRKLYLRKEFKSRKMMRTLISKMNKKPLKIPIIFGKKYEVLNNYGISDVLNLNEIIINYDIGPRGLLVFSGSPYTMSTRNKLPPAPESLQILDPYRASFREDFLEDQTPKPIVGFQEPFEHIEFSLLPWYSNIFSKFYPELADQIDPVPEFLTRMLQIDRRGSAMMDSMFSVLEFHEKEADNRKFSAYAAALFGIEITSIESIPSIDVTYAYVNICQETGTSDLNQPFTPVAENILQYISNRLEGYEVRKLASYLHIPDSEFLSIKQFIDCLWKGDINTIEFKPEVLKRITFWKSMSETQKVILSRYYDLREEGGRFFVYPSKPISENFEKVVQMYNIKTADSIVKTYGIVVPNGISNYKYLEDNLHEYVQMFDRKEKLYNDFPSLTDKELIKYIGAHVGHFSRDDLLQKASMFYLLGDDPTFFIPLERNSINKYLLSSIPPYNEDDLASNPKNNVIAYGTKDSYHLFEISELSSGFIDENLSIPNPENIAQYIEINIYQSKQLINLIQMYPITSDSETLLGQIEYAIKTKSIGNEQDKMRYLEYLKFDTLNRTLMIDCLKDLFYLGMYFKRWTGPGNPFPSREDQTITAGYDGNRDSAATMHSFITHYEALTSKDLINNLQIVEHAAGLITIQKIKFLTFWEQLTGSSQLRKTEELRKENVKLLEEATKRMSKEELETFRVELSSKRVAEGDYCIRMASSILIGTGHYYAKLFTNLELGSDEIGGYDPKKSFKIL
jgi:hypothetical protein